MSRFTLGAGSQLAAQHVINVLAGVRDMKVHEAISIIEEDGWRLVATKGSHRQFKHPRKLGRVTIAGKPSDDLAPGTFRRF
jgi:predicted RNA binding protein YcfA (HicA-like mRNA interferase family)